MRFENQLKTFLRILEEYEQNVPLSKFLPVFFRANKQMGSTDRRNASGLLYNYFRLGKASSSLPVQDRLFLALFLCNNAVNPFLEYFKPELSSRITHSLDEKILFLQEGDYGFSLKDVFPFHEHLSAGIEKDAFLRSFFIQPDLFIRLHRGKEQLVKSTLQDEGISFKEQGGAALRLPNGTKLTQLFSDPESVFEVQDLSSQQAGNYFKPAKWDYWWDACAASGGKSLLLFDKEPTVKLLVSDVRESILANLDERFRNAGLLKYQKKVLDLTQDPQPVLHDFEFDGIILDAPCSGSGTWGRSPEMISQFREGRIEAFQNLQRSIITNVIKYLKPRKPFIYITCSAFREENEENVDFIISEFGLKLEAQEVLKGYQYKADTMFVARLVKG
ncbi:RsmB/NOP family class I SAM-dependent RNA methyltransferase [Desertivirga xinjiangensis]|uniref:RsmB/NOP family class I SAM-dependent RNA methyltransferase n=1 Tax=Desertivirga xinjiangensis TaxID=539206 RepID=UPI00210BE586|nr:RsmB/NOP family class I SAM-dependent RNA methyltransferase [Pedobacter xinjiangensis]